MVPDSFSSVGRTVGVALLLVGLVLAGGTATTVAASDSISLVTMNDTVRVHAAEDASLHGTSDLPADTDLTVRLQSAGDTQPRLFQTRDVSIDEDGSFAATFDMSAYEPGDRFTATVVYNGSAVAERSVTVVSASTLTTPTPSPSPTPTTSPGFGVVAGVVALALLGVRHARD